MWLSFLGVFFLVNSHIIYWRFFASNNSERFPRSKFSKVMSFGVDVALLWLFVPFFSRACLGHPVLPLRFIINNCNAFFFGECWGFTFTQHSTIATQPEKNYNVNHPSNCKIEALLHYCNPTKDQNINKRQKNNNYDLWPRDQPSKTGWWFQTFFIFTPYLKKIPILTHIFSNGLVQPPTIQNIEALVFGFD